MTQCAQFREMYEAYALGTLDVAEHSAFEAHLATGCGDCERAVEEARWAVSQLAYLAPEAAPSDMLKGRLMKTVRAEGARVKGAPPTKTVIPVRLWAGVAALLLLTAYSEWSSMQLRNEIRQTNERTTALLEQRRNLEAQLELAKREASIMMDPSSVKVALSAKNPQMPALEAMWHSQMGLVLTGQRVPMPSGKRVLQLWLIPKAPGSKPMPSMTMRPDADGKLMLLVANPPEVLAETKALAITEEPEGGSAQPTMTPAWVGGLS
jgi:anti-sigma-K factor RskA